MIATAIGALLTWGLATSGGCIAEEDTPAEEERACEDLLVPQPCFDCLEGACCEALRACFDETGEGSCTLCLTGDAEACQASQPALALFGCLLQGCSDTCGEDAPSPSCEALEAAPSEGACAPAGERVTCNPITNAECDGDAGEACDFDAGRFRCFPGENDRELCEPCGAEAGFCAPGLSCYPNVKIGTEGIVIEKSCARACCDDGDCGGGTCAGAVRAGDASVGVCLEKGGT